MSEASMRVSLSAPLAPRRPPFASLVAALFGVAWLVASPAHAQLAADTGEPDAVIAQLRESVTFARFDEALEASRRLLQRGDLAARQRNAVLEALATVQIATNAESDARGTLEELYRRDPQHRLADADASPRVQSAFARARDAHPAPIAVRLEQAPLDLRRREAPVVTVRVLVGGEAVEEVRLAYRHSGESRFTRIVMALERGVARARLPLAGGPSEAGAIDYFIEAVAPSLTPLARLGSEAEPLVASLASLAGASTVPSPAEVAQQDANAPGTWQTGVAPGAPPQAPAPADEGGSIASRWWFWTLIGVVVVGGAVGTYAAVSSSGEPPTGTLGAITLD
jgi:hypothetical protein